MKKIIIAFLLFASTITWAECPNGNTTEIGANSVGSGKMPYEITLNYDKPYCSFFRINWWGMSEVFRFDISTDKGKQIYAMLLASKAQCRTLTIYTGDNACDGDGCYTKIKKIVLQ